MILKSDSYRSKILPYIDPKYFFDPSEAYVLKTVCNYIEKYTQAPDKVGLLHELFNGRSMNEDEKMRYGSIVRTIYEVAPLQIEWAIDATERFCRQKATYLAMSETLTILEGETDGKMTADGAIDMLREAVNLKFDYDLGHDYFVDASKRFEYYNKEESKIPFRIAILDKVTNGGIGRKTLNIVVAGVNSGKTGFMCNLVANYIRQGLNVVYFSLEMAEEEIAKRIDANLMNIEMDKFTRGFDVNAGISKVETLRQTVRGEFVVKDYPAGTANARTFRAYLKELEHHRGFKVDVIVVDYLGICSSSRVSLGRTATHEYQKYISEELRGLAYEFDAAVWTGQQLNRQGYGNTDVDLDDVADSFAVTGTADFQLALIRTEELDRIGQVLLKQIKSRYGNKAEFLRFQLGVLQQYQRYFDVDTDIVEELPPMGYNDSDGSASRWAGLE